MTNKPIFNFGTPERKLVYAYEGQLEAAVAAERERCAKIAETCELEIINLGYAAARKDIAAAIRNAE